jgi:hypothetical protein
VQDRNFRGAEEAIGDVEAAVLSRKRFNVNSDCHAGGDGAGDTSSRVGKVKAGGGHRHRQSYEIEAGKLSA